MKHFSQSALFLCMTLCLTASTLAQSNNTMYAKDFPGTTVGQKVTAAQDACGTHRSTPCTIVIDPSLASYPSGTMPSRCASCTWIDDRSESPIVPSNNSKTTDPAIAPSSSLSVLADGASTSSSDNSKAINQAITTVASEGGGTVSIPNGTFHLTHDIDITHSNITIEGQGPGTVLYFDPSGKIVEGTNQEAVYIAGNITHRREIATAVPVGSTSFTLSQASDGSDLTAGEWLIMEEYDQGAGPNQVVSTWNQVASVSGTTVTLNFPTSTTIPHLRPWNNTAGAYSGSSFYGVTRPVEHVTVNNLSIVVPANPV